MLQKFMHFSRRKFLDYLLGGGLLALLGLIIFPVFRFLVPSKAVATQGGKVLAAMASELKPNSGKIFRYGNKPAILIRTPSMELRAFTAVCAHLTCTVQYRPDLEHIWCACHNGHFDLHGRNIGGPPPRPLDAYEVAQKGDSVYVSRKV